MCRSNLLRSRLSRRLASLALVTIATALAPGVALADTPPPGDIPDNQAFVTYHGSGYSLKVPEGWSRTTTAGSATFVDKYNAITVAIAARRTAPTVASVGRSELAQLKAATTGFAQPAIAAVRRPVGSGVRITYRATSAPSSVTGKRITTDVERYELWHAGTLVIVTLQAPRGSDNVDAWRLVTSSVRLAQ